MDRQYSERNQMNRYHNGLVGLSSVSVIVVLLCLVALPVVLIREEMMLVMEDAINVQSDDQQLSVYSSRRNAFVLLTIKRGRT